MKFSLEYSYNDKSRNEKINCFYKEIHLIRILYSDFIHFFKNFSSLFESIFRKLKLIDQPMDDYSIQFGYITLDKKKSIQLLPKN